MKLVNLAIRAICLATAFVPLLSLVVAGDVAPTRLRHEFVETATAWFGAPVTEDVAPKITTPVKDEAGGAWEGAAEYETEHFLLRTNIPREEGIAVARQMDLLYKFIHKTFPGLQPEKAKLVSYIFKDQREYDAVMKKVHPDTVGRGGFYNYSDHKTHFFKHRPDTDVWKTILKTDPDADIEEYTRSVWLHETTHQVLHECVKKEKELEKDPLHYWVMEGVATYFESLRLKEDGTYDVGYPEHYRFRNIRKYFVKRATDLDLNALITSPRSKVFGEKKTSQLNYHMSIILCDFLFKHGDGKYRDKFLRYVVEVHKGSAAPGLFTSSVGVEPAALTTEWREYIQATFR